MRKSSPPVPLTLRAWLRWDIIQRWVDEISPKTVLEFGCGMGAAGSRLSRGRTYTGIEPDTESRTVAAERVGSNGRVLPDDSELAPGEQFDLVCAFEVLEHIEDDRAALRAWVDRVRPGGHLLLSVPAWQERYGPMDAEVGHFRRYDPDALAAVLATTELQTVRTVMYGWPLAYVLEGVRNRALRRAAERAAQTPMEARSHHSGRAFQPHSRVTGMATELITLPFRYAQRLQKSRGTGLLVLARRPG
jgi:SAM-dependent methyltransferase